MTERPAGPGVTAPLLVMAFGVALTGSVLSEGYLAYVRPEMATPLLITGAALVFLAGWTMMTPPSEEASEHLPRSAWLMLAPVVVSAVVTPAALGSSFALQRAPRPVAIQQGGFLPLPPGDPLAVPIDVYAERAVGGGEDTLEGRRFVVTGFATPRPDGGWFLTRLTMRCCAGDATPILVDVTGASAPPADSWVSVTGIWVPAGADRSLPRLQASAVQPAETPRDPYVVR